VTDVEISADGTVFAKYENGDLKPLYQIALADVASPDKLRPLPGNVYSQGIDSGVITTGFAGSGHSETSSPARRKAPTSISPSELTDMIASQRSYTANSKSSRQGPT
jgi:flagellar hook protein FlgE